jgi:hypothetical protein
MSDWNAAVDGCMTHSSFHQLLMSARPNSIPCARIPRFTALLDRMGVGYLTSSG